jgi:hypothetical protein
MWAILMLVLLAALAVEPAGSSDENWISLFNGRDLSGWTAKIRYSPVGENALDTFRVEDGLLTVSYDRYDKFGDRFGHLFYEIPYSYYRVRLEYRFVGEPLPDTPDWAIRNSGIMLHSQPPESMPSEQDFPISIEFQLLGGLGDGQRRPTGNLCTPGTHVVYQGEFTEQHCVQSTSDTFDGDVWVRAEALVLGDNRITHFINDEAVLAYGQMTTGGGVVSGYRAEMKPEGQPLAGGYLSLQSEGHPVQFRNIQLLNLQGCRNPKAKNFRDDYVADDPESCRF